ncbi:MAG: 2,3-bisphosphoglycerate-independent phosphoglycerate mutase [Nitrospira sp.]|nr:2,3-bisphosphoglycerate-independent phosphoglycerate mutase [Candidatus Manganitrophaceae bacterium]HIL35205.1 2,3-bisphosphoglycerate-independent phosphoglycerate mutase [Candidatus Manganitrophaceae bacterium]
MSLRPKPVLLLILDGWGINARSEGNAIALAEPQFYQSLLENFPATQLDASGEAVGLPEGQMGNSEVGHMNIGAGRIVYQDLTQISKAISGGFFAENETLRTGIQTATREKSTLHLMGLLSDGGVHSHIDHLFSLLDMARAEGVTRLRVHPFLDGRDTPPKSAPGYIDLLEKALDRKKPGGADWRIATVIGRYYAMDRDQRWERLTKAYEAIVSGTGVQADSASAALEESYKAGVTDEFVVPVVIYDREGPVGAIEDRDSLLFFNFRADRARQMTRALTEKKFDDFSRKCFRSLASFVSMTSYGETFTHPVGFQSVQLGQVLGEVLSERGLRQLRIAETEKYAHVTYFFNGGREAPFEGEERILIPSPKDVATYDEKPQMSAFELKDQVICQIKQEKFDFIVLNFANPDMVGHSGKLEAAIQAVKVIDQCLDAIVETVLAAGGSILITADHGNLEQMLDYETGAPHTAHTTLPVPLILVSHEQVSLRPGIHADLAPTILDLMQIPKPLQMDRDSLIVWPEVS